MTTSFGEDLLIKLTILYYVGPDNKTPPGEHFDFSYGTDCFTVQVITASSDWTHVSGPNIALLTCFSIIVTELNPPLDDNRPRVDYDGVKQEVDHS